ncbi:MAG: hypothetical protein WDZ36_01470 [Balneolaceae bacterium]
MMGVIFLFIDGIGLGKPGPENPLSDVKWEAFKRLTGGEGLVGHKSPVQSRNLFFTGVDATLGVNGLPQSGTGQASLFTGKNAAKILGRHFGPYPHSAIRYLLEEESLFHQVMDAGLRPQLINAYPEVYFKTMTERNRWTCTTLMAKSVGQNLNGLEQVQEGRSITAGMIQHAWREKLNLDVEEITPEIAADRLIEVSDSYDLVMYEYYLTDKAGHSKSEATSYEILSVLNRFLSRILDRKRPDTTMVLSSDHGNLENLAVKTHTRNPVPLIISGTGASEIKRAESIMDVPAVILQLLQ